MTTPEPTASQPESTRTGPGRLLVAVYGLFALSASARAGVQIATKFQHAPVAYVLSAFAGVVYILATVTLTVGSRTARRIALISCSIELVGVLAVGTWSTADPASFPDATVWSGYGSGYGFVPLVLPVFGLLWLRYWSKRTRSQRPAEAASDGASNRAAADVVAAHDTGNGGSSSQNLRGNNVLRGNSGCSQHGFLPCWTLLPRKRRSPGSRRQQW
jgi:hypothetical protein